jgi:hypothetical protein
VLLAHIAGIPVEETALSAAPVAAVIGSVALLRLRDGLRRAKSNVKRGREGNVNSG